MVLKNKSCVSVKNLNSSWNLLKIGATVGVEEWEVHTVGYKIVSKVYCTAWGIEPITLFCNNYKWKITFKMV